MDTFVTLGGYLFYLLSATGHLQHRAHDLSFISRNIIYQDEIIYNIFLEPKCVRKNIGSILGGSVQYKS